MLDIGTSLTLKPSTDIFQIVGIYPAGQGLKEPTYEVCFPSGIQKMDEKLLLELFEIEVSSISMPGPSESLSDKKKGGKDGR